MHQLIPGFRAPGIVLPPSTLAQELPRPAGQAFAGVVPGGTTILPNGRLITPQGARLYTGGNLWNVVPSPDGKWIVSFCETGIVVCSSKDPAPRSPSFRIRSWRSAFCVVFTKEVPVHESRVTSVQKGIELRP